MEIILLERVEKLGQMGDVVTVKDGYARNFLLPKKKALRATAENQRVFDSQKKEIEASNLKAKKEADGIAAKMDGLSITLLRQAGESGQLYGSVNSRDIAAALGAEGFKIVREQVTLERPIKETGISEVTVRLHPEVAVGVTVNTARSAEEAEMQAKKGAAISAEEIFETKELAEAAEEAIHEAEAEECGVEEEPAEETAAESPTEGGAQEPAGKAAGKGAKKETGAESPAQAGEEVAEESGGKSGAAAKKTKKSKAGKDA